MRQLCTKAIALNDVVQFVDGNRLLKSPMAWCIENIESTHLYYRYMYFNIVFYLEYIVITLTFYYLKFIYSAYVKFTLLKKKNTFKHMVFFKCTCRNRFYKHCGCLHRLALCMRDFPHMTYVTNSAFLT